MCEISKMLQFTEKIETEDGGQRIYNPYVFDVILFL